MEKKCANRKNCTEKHEIWRRKNDYNLMRCASCGLAFMDLADSENHVETVYGDDYFFSGKQGYPNYLEGRQNLVLQGKKYAGLLARHMPPGSLLDVGCAAGFIMKGFSEMGWNTHGVEPNNSMASFGRREFGMDITTGSLESFDSGKKYDVISLIQVIGHFYDIDAAFEKISSMLKKDGLVLIESWNRKSVYARLMGNHWHELSPPTVLNWFSDDTLAVFMRQHGFTLVEKGKKGKRINVRHALSLLDESLPDIFIKKHILKVLKWCFGKYTIYYPPLDLKWYMFRQI